VISRLTTLIFLGRETHAHSPVWECLESCSGLAEQSVICDLGMGPEAAAAVAEFRRLKRRFEIRGYCSVEHALSDFRPRSIWTAIIFGDEVVHENSRHYLWDLAGRHHADFDGAEVPVHAVFANWTANSGHGVAGYKDIRLADSNKLSQLKYDGFKMRFPGANLAPMQLNPKPIWKLLLAFPEQDSPGCGAAYPFEPEHEAAAPAPLRRLLGRRAYSPPYIMDGGNR